MKHEPPEFNIAHLFFAGMVTAAGAGLFWLITQQFKRKESEPEPADLNDGNLDDMLIAATAATTD